MAITLVTLTVAVAPAALAEGFTLRVSPFATYRAGGQFEDVSGRTTRTLGSHAGVAFAVGLTAGESAKEYELFYSRQATRIGGHAPFDVDVEYLHFGGTVDYGDESERYVPYVVGGLGATRMTPHGPGLSDETHWSASLGGGLKVPVTERVLIRLELRGYFTSLHGHSDIFCISSNGSANCAIRVKGNGLFQGEALGGVSFRF
jgi:hypothetical protein